MRTDPNIFKDVSTSSKFIPTERALNEEVDRIKLRVLRVKACPWLEYIVLSPSIEDWQRRQEAMLFAEENPVDTMFKGAMDFLDVNDLSSVTQVISEAAATHSEITGNKKDILEQESKSKVASQLEILSQNKQSQGLSSTVSATNMHEIDNNVYVHMANALTGNKLRDERDKRAELIQK